MKKLLSKRMRSMDHSFDDYSSLNDDGFATTNAALINSNPALHATTTTTTTTTATTTTTLAARKQLAVGGTTTAADVSGSGSGTGTEPTKPLSAYALFFRDTVSAIKQQNPSCSFQDLSRIVASMWEALDPTHKNVYQKKHEIACNEYLNQMLLFKQYQAEQQQQQQHLINSSNDNLSNNASLQTKPAVFTIECNNNSNNNNINNALHTAIVGAPNKTTLPQPTTPQQQQMATSTHAQTNESSLQQQQQQQQQQQLYVAQNNNTTPPAVGSTIMTTTTATTDNTTLTDSTTPQQMLTEAGSVQKCTRENCNKRAIINPDWEDEYCSNECVVIHCRNVFNEWVKSNLDARKQ